MSHKHSFSVPSTPATNLQPPVSPFVTRSAKIDRPRQNYAAPPVTPQRLPRQQQNQNQNYPQVQFRTPITPSTPYTPLSLRSFSSSASSALTTPASIKRPNFTAVSPDVMRGGATSLADIAENWRSRATENGIKVSSASEGDFGDDEASDHTLSEANDSGIVTEDVLLPSHFLNSRRRAQSLSFSHVQNVNPHSNPRALQAPTSPLMSRLPRASFPMSPQVTRTPVRQTLAPLNTPPPNRSAAQQLKLKGSFTDPAHTRRRPPFTQVPPSELCDINEDDYETSYDYDYEPFPQYPQSFVPQLQSLQGLGDPFRGPALGSIAETRETHFHDYNQNQNYIYDHQLQFQEPPYAHNQFPQPEYAHYNRAVPIPTPAFNPPAPQKSARPATSTCSVCDRSGSLAILEPCGHPLCSACLTSALNIVGEKDMECAVCKLGVADFKLIGPGKKAPSAEVPDMTGKSFMDPLFSSPSSVGSGRRGRGLLPSALDPVGEPGSFFDGVRASTPNGEGAPKRRQGDCVVLRIDNVPWDITPPSIANWLQQPVERVHVLLDRKGKTQSYAFVEVKSEEVARAILRGEVYRSVGGQWKQGWDREVNIKMGRGSVLGKGRRARGVTVTKSGQEELMSALFPAWKGNFDGSRPSLAGLDNGHVRSTLEGGLMTEGEITALLHLIRSPDSHFLKVPSLPFHSLISILSKFPADVDSRVFWSGALRDMLYEVTLSAIQVLLSRIEESHRSDKGDFDENVMLLTQLSRSASDCQAFTTQQVNKFADLVTSCPFIAQDSMCSTSSGSGSTSPPTMLRTPECDRSSDFPQVQALPDGAGDEHIDALAREFGVEAHLVQALAQRLAVLS